jgi:hypothetical protein
MALILPGLLNRGPGRYAALVYSGSSINRVWRMLASLLMLVAALGLAPTAMAGSFEASKDSAAIAFAASAMDADGCVSAENGADEKRTADGQHCPACCLHHHGPNGLVGDAAAFVVLEPSRQSWGNWQPASMLQAPSLVMIQPPRA